MDRTCTVANPASVDITYCVPVDGSPDVMSRAIHFDHQHLHATVFIENWLYWQLASWLDTHVYTVGQQGALHQSVHSVLHDLQITQLAFS